MLFSRDVYKFDKFSDEAIKMFKEHKAEMHPVTAIMVTRDLKINP